jgi:hypothetical protein
MPLRSNSILGLLHEVNTYENDISVAKPSLEIGSLMRGFNLAGPRYLF